MRKSEFIGQDLHLNWYCIENLQFQDTNSIATEEVYSNYLTFCQNEGFSPLAESNFKKQLGPISSFLFQKPIYLFEKKSGTSVFRNIKLKTVNFTKK